MCYNRGHKIMKHFKILMSFDSPQLKWYIKSSTKNIAYELPLECPNDLRLRILGNQEIMEKFQKWVEAELSTQSTFQWSKITQKQISNKFLILSSFA